MKFEELKKGNLYSDSNGEYIYIFVEMRNNQLATFKGCEYNEERGDFSPTEEETYLTANEVKRLKEI